MTNLQIQDLLLNSMQFVAVNAVSGGTVVAASDPSTTTPGGAVSRTLGSVIGTTATTDDSLLFTFYTPLNTSAGAALALRSFTATRRDNVIRVERQTGAEFNTLGFRVYRSDDRTRRRAVLVTSQLIAGRGRSGGANYAWDGAAAQPGTTYYYWLEEVELNGSVNEYGPARAVNCPTSAPYQLCLPLVVR